MQVILQADQKQKKKHKNEILPAHPQDVYLLVREFGPMLNQENSRCPVFQCRRTWSIFVMKPTSRQGWSDWILENERWSSETFCVFIRPILRKVEGGVARGGNKKRFQCCTDSSGAIFYLRALQGHSGRNLIDFSLQDNVVIPSVFFQYIYHIGCAISLHFIINAGLITGGPKFEQSTDGILSACGSHVQNVGILLRSIWMNRVLQNTCREHGRNIKHVVLGRHQPCSEERIEVLSNTIERYHSILHETLPAYGIPKVVRMKIGEVMYEKENASPRPPPKISLNSEVARQPEGEVARQAKVHHQANQIQIQFMIERWNFFLPSKRGAPFSGNRNTSFSWSCETR